MCLVLITYTRRQGFTTPSGCDSDALCVAEEKRKRCLLFWLAELGCMHSSVTVTSFQKTTLNMMTMKRKRQANMHAYVKFLLGSCAPMPSRVPTTTITTSHDEAAAVTWPSQTHNGWYHLRRYTI